MDDLNSEKTNVSRRAPFFRKIDWASFWTATIVSFVVYFLTLSPSVSLEDSGELAVAGDHLGVPHPPGYPIWTMISFVFARVFSFVTFRGQPTPAWSIALASGVFGALAAGCTAMLITRSSSDMLRTADDSIRDENDSRNNLFSWAAGVAGSLIFAFSPVMWSQSTIVEVYALGAFFLMLVMLLTYRWMRQPSDKLLWITAFVFGLGLTNYQVLLLAALPLVVIVFLRNISLFRDFLLILIPYGVGALLLKIGSEPFQPGLVKHKPLPGKMLLPSNALCVASLVVAALVILALLLWPVIEKRLAEAKEAKKTFFLVSIAGFALSVLLMFIGAAVQHEAVPLEANPSFVTLIAPAKYAYIAMLVLAVVGVNAVSAVFDEEKASRFRWTSIGISVLLFLVTLAVIGALPAPPRASLAGVPKEAIYPFARYSAAIVCALILMVALAATAPKGIYFAIPVAVVELTVLALTAKGAMMGLTHPSTWWFWAPMSFNFAILLLASLALPHGISAAMTVFCAELGVSFYVYMPISSDVRNPPMNWGYPRTWEGFKHALTRGQYEAIAPTNIFAPKFLKQIGSYFTDLRTQFTLLIAPFGFLPFAAWRLRRDGEEKVRGNGVLIFAGLVLGAFVFWGVDGWVAAEMISDKAATILRSVSVALLVAAVVQGVLAGIRPLRIAALFTFVACVFVVIGQIPGIEQIVDMTRIDKLAVGGLLLTGLIGGAMLVYKQIEDSAREMVSSKDRSRQTTVCLVLAGLLLGALGFLFKTIQALLVWSKIKGHFHGNVQAALENWDKFSPYFLGDKVIALSSAAGALVIVAVVLYVLHLAYNRKAVNVSVDNVTQQWLIGTFCNFFVMSFVLIVLANPKGDLQDSFIQKVKFISSHGLFALWIGYGLLFALVVVKNVCRGLFGGDERKLAPAGRYVLGVGVAGVLALSLVPIYENYFNDQLVFELGGAEQNGHDYGWQFGNYQLRGADAITEELEEDEEPLPNPSYPPEMGPGAVFFGGTDPGRFVPTYMIYSADVRPDVFLITQNALADNTFMSTTRDLYGDQLWIPTPKESANAFNIYIEEVQSGKRPNNADIIMENGRAQVVGALGVMEINGILCEQIFNHNKPWHKFYVEESYVIPWMYPYLTPHGLIMHINPEKTPIPPANVADDLDFWDWYTRRITRDDKYRRDIVAQKSFSKLRSAIAGLYMARGRERDAEQAYSEARVLYPVSPEATFRMVQDVYLRHGRYEEALEVVSYYCRKDPNNERGFAFKKFIEDTIEIKGRLAVYLEKYPEGKVPPPADAVEMAKCYRDLNMSDRAQRLIQSVSTLPMSTVQAYSLAVVARDAGNPHLAAQLLDRAEKSQAVRGSAAALMDAVQIYVGAGRYEKVEPLLDLYLAKKPNDYAAWIDAGSIALARGDKDKAFTAFVKAMQIDRKKASEKIEANPQVVEFLNRELERRNSQAAPQPAGGVAPGVPGVGGFGNGLR